MQCSYSCKFCTISDNKEEIENLQCKTLQDIMSSQKDQYFIVPTKEIIDHLYLIHNKGLHIISPHFDNRVNQLFNYEFSINDLFKLLVNDKQRNFKQVSFIVAGFIFSKDLLEDYIPRLFKYIDDILSVDKKTNVIISYLYLPPKIINNFNFKPNFLNHWYVDEDNLEIIKQIFQIRRSNEKYWKNVEFRFT